MQDQEHLPLNVTLLKAPLTPIAIPPWLRLPTMDSAREIHQTDVLICGSGSAGLMAALWLAKYGISFRILERRSGPLVTGQADGVQCRTVEIFESFGLSDKLLRESYHVLELAFWAHDQGTAMDASSSDEKSRGGGIKRTHYAADTEPGLSHQPHVILNQARINAMITDEMLSQGGPEVDYGYEVKGVEVDPEKVEDPEAYPVTVTTSKGGREEVFHAKYVLVSALVPKIYHRIRTGKLCKMMP